MQTDFWVLIALLLSVMFISVKTGKLDVAGALTGGFLGLLIYLGAGFTGIAMVGTFFILGTAATSWKFKLKQQFHLAEKQRGKRRASQVAANAGFASLLGLMTMFFPEHKALLRMMIAAGFSSATADTLSSEMGNVYGRRFYNILSFKRDKRGLDGVVSLEGTLFGLAGSVIIAMIYAIGFGWSAHLWWIIIAGTAGNMIDSVLGASVQRRHYLNNDAVNFFNTMAASLIAWLLAAIFS